MSHTHHTHHARQGTRFFHNGDYSGTVSVIVPDLPRSVTAADLSVSWEIPVPFADLRELVFAYLRDRETEFLEQASDDDFESRLLRSGGTS